MKHWLIRTLLAAALIPLGVAQAQTLRWASQGDPQTMDPHSQNESLTNAMNGQVYEYLVARDKQLNIVPGLATEWKQIVAAEVALQAAPEREVPRRHAVHRRRRRVLDQPRARSRPRRSPSTPTRSARRRRSTT